MLEGEPSSLCAPQPPNFLAPWLPSPYLPAPPPPHTHTRSPLRLLLVLEGQHSILGAAVKGAALERVQPLIALLPEQDHMHLYSTCVGGGEMWGDVGGATHFYQMPVHKPDLLDLYLCTCWIFWIYTPAGSSGSTHLLDLRQGVGAGLEQVDRGQRVEHAAAVMGRLAQREALQTPAGGGGAG